MGGLSLTSTIAPTALPTAAMFLNVIALVVWVFSVTAAANYRRLGNLVERCKFSVGNETFDLCPVLSGNEGGWTIEFDRRTPPTITKTIYKIGLKEKLEVDGSKPKHEQVRSMPNAKP